MSFAAAAFDHSSSSLARFFAASEAIALKTKRSDSTRSSDTRFMDSPFDVPWFGIAAIVASLLLQNDMSRRAMAGGVLGALVAKCAQVEPLHQMFASAEEDGGDDEVKIVEEARLQILADRRHAAADADVPIARGLARALQRFIDSARHEVEHRSSLHRERRARVMRQHEDRHVVRRFLAPPSLPALVRPGPADGAEHVAAHDPRSDILEASGREFVVDTLLTTVAAAVHCLERARVEEPLEHLRSAHAERMLERLVGPGTEAIEGSGKTENA